MGCKVFCIEESVVKTSPRFLRSKKTLQPMLTKLHLLKMAEKYLLITKQQYIHFILNIEQIPNSKTSDGNGSGNGFQRQHINVNKCTKWPERRSTEWSILDLSLLNI